MSLKIFKEFYDEKVFNSFIEEIIKEPYDYVTRGVFADWLEENEIYLKEAEILRKSEDKIFSVDIFEDVIWEQDETINHYEPTFLHKDKQSNWDEVITLMQQYPLAFFVQRDDFYARFISNRNINNCQHIYVKNKTKTTQFEYGRNHKCTKMFCFLKNGKGVPSLINYLFLKSAKIINI